MESINYNINESNNKKLLGHFKRFLGFGESPDNIKVILPQVQQNRIPTLKCNNYPKFSYAISPDDVFTALRVYSKLALIYGNKVQVESSKEWYLFNWDANPGNDSQRLLEYLKQKFNIDRAKIVDFRKIENIMTIIISNKKNSILLKLNDEKTMAKIEIDDGRTDELIAITENGKLNIYKEFNLKPSSHIILIGSPVTNPLSSKVLNGQNGQKYYFGSGENDHNIVSSDGNKRYVVEFDNKNTLKESNIIKDYSLITKRSIDGKVEIVLAGCRAYGQLALWDILDSMDFYEQIQSKMHQKDFQILIQVNVIGRTCKDWKILDD